MFEQQLMHKRVSLAGKLPEIKKAVEVVDTLIKRSEEGEEVRWRGVACAAHPPIDQAACV